MQRKILWVVVLGFYLSLPGLSIGDSSELGKDAIFVSEPGQKGIYHKTTGKIVELTSSEMVIETNGRELLYKREAVRRVVLAPGVHDEKIQGIVNVYWNRKESEIVKAVMRTPIIGPYLTFLDNLSGAARMFLAILVFLCLVFYAAYKLYEMLVVATNLRNLNTLKLNMEVRKLRYELNDIEERLGVSPAIPSENASTEEIENGTFPFHLEIPKVNILDFIKYKILRIFTEEEKKRRMELQRKKWLVLKEKSKWVRVAVYYFRVLVNLMGTFLAGSFSVGSFVNIILPFIEPEALNGMSPFYSLVFLLFFIVSFGIFLRSNSQRRIILATYRETFFA